MDGANDYAAEFMVDYNRRFAREPQSAHDAHRPLLPHEKLDRVFTWQEERRLTQNLTLHYKRVMYLIEPSDFARSAAGKYVLVRETNDGEVVIEHKGVALAARKFVKDARVSQAAIADNKILGPLLAEIQKRQQERDAETLATKRLTPSGRGSHAQRYGRGRSVNAPQASSLVAPPSLPANGVVLDHLTQGGDAAVVHVGSRQRRVRKLDGRNRARSGSSVKSYRS